MKQKSKVNLILPGDREDIILIIKNKSYVIRTIEYLKKFLKR